MTSSRLESSSSVPWLNMRSGVANCAFPEILRPSARMSLRPPISAGHAELAKHLHDRAR